MNLKKIQRIVFSCKPLELIDFDVLATDMSWEDQQQFLYDTLLSKTIGKYPIKFSYQLLFMKKLIEALEKSTDEVHDQLYEYFCELKIKQHNNQDEYSFKHFIHDDLEENIIIKETNSIISNGTTGLSTWEAALTLASWASENKRDLKDKNVLEIGSGTGYAGIFIGKACSSKHIILSDCHEDVLKLLKENVRINFHDKCDHTNRGLKQNTLIDVKTIFWGTDLRGCIGCEYIPDYLIASDIIYDDTLFDLLIKTIDDVFELNSKCIFILACTIRNEETLTKFLHLINESRYEVKEEQVHLVKKIPVIKTLVKIYRIKLKSNSI